MANNPDPAARLDPAAREILDEYIQARESKSFYRGITISVSAILTFVAMIGGAFLYIKDAAINSSTFEVNRLFQDYKTSELDSEFEKVRAETQKQGALFENLRAEIRSTYGNVLRTSQQIESLHEKARSVLEALNKGKGSLAFEQEIISLRSDIIELKAQWDGFLNSSRDLPASVDLQPSNNDQPAIGDRPLDGIFTGE